MAEEAKKKETNAAERLVKVKLPRYRNKKGEYANVNNRNYFIPRGEVVEVPYFIAAILENSMNQDEETARLIDSLSQGANY